MYDNEIVTSHVPSCYTDWEHACVDFYEANKGSKCFFTASLRISCGVVTRRDCSLIPRDINVVYSQGPIMIDRFDYLLNHNIKTADNFVQIRHVVYSCRSIRTDFRRAYVKHEKLSTI